MTIKFKRTTIEFYGFNDFFLSAFGIEAFKEPGERIIISRRL
jgi:hypothetical protein